MARTSPLSPAHPGRQFARTALVVAVMALALAACGRRGALEPPPDPNAPREQTQADAADSGVVASPIPGGAKKRPKGVTVPNRPFILDSLL